ncbi:MAG: MiaB/RimO family radical SAM methylthiotransferase [Planctomycetota bacterium]
MKTFAYKTLGCKVNQYEGDSARAHLERLGCVEVTEGADLALLNACAVTQRAVQKTRQALRRLHSENPAAAMVLTGCMTPSDIASFREIDPNLHLAVNLERDLLASLLASLTGGSEPPEGGHLSRHRTRAYLKVQDGCNLRCSFCIIPNVRGRSRSRPLASVIDEFRRLEAQGHLEIVLCGIHLGHWGLEHGLTITELLEALLRARSGEARLRLSSLEVNELSPALLDILASTTAVVPHLHLPLQSGSDVVLRAMRRPYTAELFEERVARLRERLLEPAITSDVIVGFPGETDDDFEQTLAVARRSRFSKIHIFPYSRREGTAAAALPGAPSPPVVRKRQSRLARLERELRADFHARFLGTTACVLVESGEGAGRATGFSERYQRVVFGAPTRPAGFVGVRLERDRGTFLEGSAVDSSC